MTGVQFRCRPKPGAWDSGAYRLPGRFFPVAPRSSRVGGGGHLGVQRDTVSSWARGTRVAHPRLGPRFQDNPVLSGPCHPVHVRFPLHPETPGHHQARDGAHLAVASAAMSKYPGVWMCFIEVGYRPMRADGCVVSRHRGGRRVPPRQPERGPRGLSLPGRSTCGSDRRRGFRGTGRALGRGAHTCPERACQTLEHAAARLSTVAGTRILACRPTTCICKRPSTTDVILRI